jgi:hypothetical protein
MEFEVSLPDVEVTRLQRVPIYLYGSVPTWPLFQFPDLFTQSEGPLWQGISPSQGRYLHTDIPASSRCRPHDPNVSASEDRSCLRPVVLKLFETAARRLRNIALDSAATVIGCSVYHLH